jgi:hypothetical protein
MNDFGSLSVDGRPLLDGGHVQPADADIGPDPTRWNDTLEFSVYADSSMTLPGTSEPAEHCGEWAPRAFCDDCGEVHFTPSRCERRTCPDCVASWTQQRATAITERLTAARYAEESGLDRRAVHAVFSAPAGVVTTLQEVYDGYRTVYRLAESHGVRGGVAIFHGFRVSDDVQEEFREADPDMGIWRWVREVRPEDWRNLSYWSPHWHVVGLCADFEENSPEVDDGWVAQRVRSVAPLTALSVPEPYDDTVGLVRYIMSHATFETESSRDCVRWFGELATMKFQADEELSDGALDVIERITEEVTGEIVDDDGSTETEEEPCPDCGSTSRTRIWEARDALASKRWCEQIGREKQQRLVAAFEWRIGERQPPPGLRSPRSEEEAREALERVL